MTNIAIFASGTGSNALKIIQHFEQHPQINVRLIVSNKAEAYVLTTAAKYDIPTLVLQRKNFYQSEQLLTDLQAHQIDFIVLAGFLWLIPAYLVKHFPKRMINIHPALLPKYGGKGMYGMHVHQAVYQAKEPETGITIHYVNEQYDEGNIIFQARCALTPQDTPPEIAKKIQQLEHQHFAKVIEDLLD